MFRPQKASCALLLAGLLAAPLAWANGETPPQDRSLSELEQRLEEIDAELEQLARSSLRSGVGAIGYRSDRHEHPGGREWVQIGFDRAYPIDEIVLVPTLWRDSREGFQADSFPEAFHVVVGTESQDEGTIIASYDTTDRLLPRIAPLTIPASGISASWVRIEATGLSRRAFDNHDVFQLSELMVFSGNRNIALRRPVTASSVHTQDLVHAWAPRFLVDGHLPYLMDAAQGSSSVAYIGSLNKHRSLAIDLGKAYPLSEIHLHTVDQSDTVPQAYSGSLGVPEDLLVEGALQADFSDAVPLLDVNLGNFTDVGPVMMWPLPETECRYVRIRSPDQEAQARFGFAEIELFSKGRNVAINLPFDPERQQDPAAEITKRVFAALTDGRNLYGNILSMRTWMYQLARRHDLENERPLVSAELNVRYARQRRNLWLMSWLAALLAAAVGFTILIDRILRMRQAAQMRERFAADLHDELGANIHTIGLLGDLARDATSKDELGELLDRSRTFTERSGVAIRNWSNMLEARGLCEDLVEEMKRSAATLLADLEYEQTFEGAEHLHDLRPRRRIDIFLFYKECLINILRHSGATRVTTHLKATPREVTLTITDNGHGLSGDVPASLKRRARLLGAKATIESVDGGGTCIILKVKRRRHRLFRR